MTDDITLAPTVQRDEAPTDLMKAAHDRLVAQFAAAHEAAIVEHEPVIEDGKVYTRREQDVDRIIIHNQHLRENHTKPYYGHDAMRLVGSIPLTVCETWAKEAGVRLYSKEFREVVRKKLLDSDYALLRVKGF